MLQISVCMLQDFQSIFKTFGETGPTTAAAAPTVTATNKLSFLLNSKIKMPKIQQMFNKNHQKKVKKFPSYLM